MKELKELIEAGNRVMLSVNANMQVSKPGKAQMRRALNAAEAALKRAKVFEGKVHIGGTHQRMIWLEGENGGVQYMNDIMLDKLGKEVVIIVIPKEDDNAGK